MGKFTAKAQAFVNYIQDIKTFATMPLWKRELAAYNSRPAKQITLPSTETKNLVEDLLKRYPAKSRLRSISIK